MHIVLIIVIIILALMVLSLFFSGGRKFWFAFFEIIGEFFVAVIEGIFKIFD